MDIRILEVQHGLLRFATSVGEGCGVWHGQAACAPGQQLDVELDFSGPLHWGRDIRAVRLTDAAGEHTPWLTWMVWDGQHNHICARVQDVRPGLLGLQLAGAPLLLDVAGCPEGSSGSWVRFQARAQCCRIFPTNL